MRRRGRRPNGGTRLGGAESKRRRRSRLPAPPSRVTRLAAEARHQLAEPRPRVAQDRRAVARQQHLDLERGERGDAGAQQRRVVHHLLAQQRQHARRVPDHGVAHDEDAPARGVERDLARRLPGHAEHGEGAELIAGREPGVDGHALGLRVGRVGGMDRDRGAGPLPHQGGLAHVVAVREDDARHPALHEAREHLLRGLDGIDAQVSLGLADEIAVEVVAVRLGEPGPGEDAIHDLAHVSPPTRSYAGTPPRVNPAPRLYTRPFWIACAIHFTGGMSLGMFLLFPGFLLAATGFALVSLGLTTLIEQSGVVPVHAPAPRSAAHDMTRLVLRGGLLPVMAATVLFGAGINAAFYFVAPFTRDLHIDRAAPFFAAYASTTIALRVFGRRLPDRMGAHPIAVPSFGVFALGLAALCLLPQRGVLVAAGMACGAGHGSLFPVLKGLAVARTPARFHGTVVSLSTAALDGGAVLGTPLCGAIAHTAGYRAMFAVMAAASLAGLLLMTRDARRGTARLGAPGPIS